MTALPLVAFTLTLYFTALAPSLTHITPVADEPFGLKTIFKSEFPSQAALISSASTTFPGL